MVSCLHKLWTLHNEVKCDNFVVSSDGKSRS